VNAKQLALFRAATYDGGQQIEYDIAEFWQIWKKNARRFQGPASYDVPIDAYAVSNLAATDNDPGAREPLIQVYVLRSSLGVMSKTPLDYLPMWRDCQMCDISFMLAIVDETTSYISRPDMRTLEDAHLATGGLDGEDQS
jgi:hypothetical protein